MKYNYIFYTDRNSKGNIVYHKLKITEETEEFLYLDELYALRVARYNKVSGNFECLNNGEWEIWVSKDSLVDDISLR